MTKESKRRLLIEIFMSFFKVGLFTFGGGFAMIPLIEKEMIDKKAWVEEEEIIDIFALSQSVPGSIAINSSTSIGYKIAGTYGAVVATIGVVLPSFMIITIIAAFLSNFQDNAIVQAAFMGVRSAVVGLVLMAAIKIGKTSIKDALAALITILTVILILAINLNVIFAIIGGGLVGWIVGYIIPLKKKEKSHKEGHKDGLS
ncbi:chromate transporter [Irregularibacter muris]|uniref:Chromate transporter n=1 Tax=Irregularibacter muris TaxID=1796619 RepID=A0AAE3KZP9_9FIRM|nr:chromate transporter [Irregularibacter muris]MCR1899565.1 chromate transporter [Irregularibacter muris]